ncbi:MAG: hypothetical protein WC236_02020 [Gallionellaceae bacterium]|jgi:hypothetical protein
MKNFANKLLSTFTVGVTVCVCNTFEARSEPVIHSGVPNAASTQENMLPAPERPSAEKQSADQRFSINLQVFGLSYHPDREGSREKHLNNEINFGLGVTHRYHNDERGVAILEAGFYNDSGNNWAYFAGASYQYKLGQYWKLGADLLIVKSQTYNNGNAFVAPIPRLTYDFGPAKLNAIYIPKVPDVNLFSVFAIYLAIPLWN